MSEKTWMTSETPWPKLGAPCVPATWGHLKMVIELLESHGVDYVVVGGFAINLLGRARFTSDIDIVVRVSNENNVKWIEALSKLPEGATAELIGLENPFSPDEGIALSENDGDEQEDGVIRVYDAFIVDVMPKACGMTYEDLEQFIRRASYDDVDFNILNGYGMMMTKRGTRPKDIGDALWLKANLGRIEESLNSTSSVLSKR